jgi:hypothetical protein
MPQPLLNTITSFVGGVGDDALLAMCVPLVAAVVSEAVGGPSGTAPTGKGKAGLQIMLAAILRTRPQVSKAKYVQLHSSTMCHLPVWCTGEHVSQLCYLAEPCLWQVGSNFLAKNI